MREKLRKNKYTPLIVILIILGIFSFPYLLQGKVPYPSDYQANKFLPWSMDENHLGPIKNEAMPDVIGQIYPWRYFTIEQWKIGEIPLWNPYSFSGTPHLANYQSAVFSPFNILFFILPFIDAWSINVLLQPLIAGIGTYLFLRAKRLQEIPSLIGATCFMFSGFIVVWMAYGTLAMAAALLPLTLFSIERIWQTKEKKFALLLALTLVSSFLSGHFQTSLYVFLFVLFYILFKFLTVKKSRKVALLVLLSLLTCLLITSLQIIPTISYYSQATRQSLAITGGGIPFTYLVTLFAPDFFGNPVTRNNWFGYYAEWASFVGIIPLTLSLFCLYAKKKKDILFFAISGFLFLLLAIDGPVQKLLIASGLPIFSTSMPSRIIFLASFSLSILTSFGAETLNSLIIKEKFKQIIPIFLAVSIGVLLIGVSTILFKTIPAGNVSNSIKNLILPFLLISIFTTVVISSFFIKKLRPYILLLAFFLTAFDSLRFASKWMPFSERENVYRNTSVIEKLQSLNTNGRVVGNYAAYIDTYYQLPSLEGFDSLYIKRYGEFLEAASDGLYHPPQRNTVFLARDGIYTQRVLETLGVTHFLHVIKDTKKSWAYPVWSDKKVYKNIYSDKDFKIYEYQNALPRARLFYNYEVIPDKKKLLTRFYTKDFDYKNILLLEKDVNRNLVVSSREGKGSVEFLKDSANEIILKVSTNSPALLFLADPYYKNWKVTVHGKKQNILLADYAFRAVQVPSGESVVKFSYDFF